MLIERWPYHTHTCLPFQVALHRLLGRCKAHIFDRAHCRRRRREIASPAVSIKCQSAVAGRPSDITIVMA